MSGWEGGAGLYSHVTSLPADILRKFDNMVEMILPQLPSDFDCVTDPEGKAALLWILGEYGEVSTLLTPLTTPIDHTPM